MKFENFQFRPESKNVYSHDAKIVSSQALMGESRILYIQHGEELYRLSKTKNGKLILNK